MYLAELRGEVSQGDIFDDLPTVYIQQAGHEPRVRYTRAIVLTHDCEYDKPRTETIIIAQVWPLSEVNKGSQGLIRQNKVLSTFYLLPYEGIMPESYVDLRMISNLEKSIIVSSAQAGKRFISLTDEARLALQRQLALFLGLDR